MRRQRSASGNPPLRNTGAHVQAHFGTGRSGACDNWINCLPAAVYFLRILR